MHEFKENELFFDSSNLTALVDQISKQDLEDFMFDIRRIDLATEGKKFMYGLDRFYNHHDVPSIESGYSSILQKNQLDWFHDIRFATNVKQLIQQKDLSSLSGKILDQQQYAKFYNLVFGK